METKRCTACGEEILVIAKLCKHCKVEQDDPRFLDQAPLGRSLREHIPLEPSIGGTRSAPPRSTSRIVLVSSLAALVAIVGVFAFASNLQQAPIATSSPTALITPTAEPPSPSATPEGLPPIDLQGLNAKQVMHQLEIRNLCNYIPAPSAMDWLNSAFYWCGELKTPGVASTCQWAISFYTSIYDTEPAYGDDIAARAEAGNLGSEDGPFLNVFAGSDWFAFPWGYTKASEYKTLMRKLNQVFPDSQAGATGFQTDLPCADSVSR